MRPEPQGSPLLSDIYLRIFIPLLPLYKTESYVLIWLRTGIILNKLLRSFFMLHSGACHKICLHYFMENHLALLIQCSPLHTMRELYFLITVLLGAFKEVSKCLSYWQCHSGCLYLCLIHKCFPGVFPEVELHTYHSNDSAWTVKADCLLDAGSAKT